MCALAPPTSFATDCPGALRGGWQGLLAIQDLFEAQISVVVSSKGEPSAAIRTADGPQPAVAWKRAGAGGEAWIYLQANRPALAFNGRISADNASIEGFIDYGSRIYRTRLEKTGAGAWGVRWSPLHSGESRVPFELYFDTDGGDGTAGYFFFRDPRLPGLYGYGTRCENKRVMLGELNLGMEFEGGWNDAFDTLRLTVTGPAGRQEIVFEPMPEERRNLAPGTPDRPPRLPEEKAGLQGAPPDTGDGWRTESPAAAGLEIAPLQSMLADIESGALPRTHAVLLARGGALLIEEYFYGYERNMAHDMRSASKSVTSTLVGLAIDRDLVGGADDLALPYFTRYRFIDNLDARKSRIRIRDLLTMSSGLDANDSDRNSVASENAYQSQDRNPDWTAFALNAPMTFEPGEHLIYGSANPMLLGGILDAVLTGRVEWFAERALFEPLGIEGYHWFTDPTGTPYMGGGLYLRPRDMLKIAQLYLDKGRWQGREVLSADWVADSIKSYGRLEPLDRNGNEYGYLWWHERYEFAGHRIDSVEARGNGGQYLFVVPELDVVAVITSGNFRGGLEMTRQPQRIFERYLLPSLFAGQ